MTGKYKQPTHAAHLHFSSFAGVCGLSGAPVIDEQGAVVGLVSNSTEDPDTGKKFFSPCTIDGLITFLKNTKRE